MFRFIRRLIVILIILFVIYLMFKAIAPNTTKTLTEKIGSFYITSECNDTDCVAVISTWDVIEDEDVIESDMEEKEEKIWFRARVRNFFSSDKEDDLENEEKVKTGDVEDIDEVEVFTWEIQTGQILSTWEIIIEIDTTGSVISGGQTTTKSTMSDEQKEAQKVIDSLF